MTTELQELSKLVQKFCEDRDWDQFHTPKNLAIGIVTEAAELLDEFRFLSDPQCLQKFEDQAAKTQIEEEIADIFFFVLRFSHRFDIDLPEALRDKLVKNGRRYPVETSKGSNLKARNLK